MSQQQMPMDPGTQAAYVLRSELGKEGIPVVDKDLEPSVVYISIGKFDYLYRLAGRCNMAVPTLDGTGIRLWVRNSSCLQSIRPVLRRMEERGYDVAVQDRQGRVLYQTEQKESAVA